MIPFFAALPEDVTLSYSGKAESVQLWMGSSKPMEFKEGAWQITMELPSDTRTTYRFIVDNQPICDPSSDKQFYYSSDMAVSVLELNEAPPYPYRDPNVAHGTVVELTATSKSLRNRRSVWVYTPNGFEGRPLPLVILFDGEAYRTLIDTPLMLDNMIGKGEIPLCGCSS